MPILPPLEQLPTDRPGRLGAAGAGLLGGGFALGAVLTRVGASRTGELRLDEAIGADHEAPLTTLARGIDVLLSPPVALAIVVITGVIVFRRNRWSALGLVVATVVGWLSVGAGKLLVGRARPPAGLVHALVHESGADSFPSGHTAFAVAILGGTLLALRIAGRSTRLAWLVGVPSVVLVAASRLYLGAHYLGDVVASNLFAGGTILLGTALACTIVQRVHPVRAGRLG